MSTRDSETSLESLINVGEGIIKLDLAEHEGNKRFIAGYANVAGIRDKQGDIVTREALVNAWNKWKSNPDFQLLSILHSNIPVAKVVLEPIIDTSGRTHQSGVNDMGLYIVGLVRDDVTIADEIWGKIERGDYRGYSIGGRNLNPQPQECKDGICTAKITDFELYEVAIVDRPANQASLFNVLKRDDLAKLAELTNKIENRLLTEGIVKVSKKPCPDGGHYHVVVNAKGALYNELAKLFDGEDMAVIEEERAGEEYVSLFNLALLRPYTGLTAEEQHGGFNSPLLENEPKTEGKTPLTKKEEVIEENPESQDDSEVSETPEVEAKQEEEEAIAPLTMEVLAAALERINQRLDDFEKRLEPKEEVKEELPENIVEVLDKVEKAMEQPAEEPTVETPPKPEVAPVVPEAEPVEAKPEPAPAPVIAPVAEPKLAPVIESRGVNAQVDTPIGLDIGSVHEKVSWTDIKNLRDK